MAIPMGLKEVGVVTSSDNRQVYWRINEKTETEWLARAGGEYHVVELSDGSLALTRCVYTKRDHSGYYCHSLFLGAINYGPGLCFKEIPAKQDSPVYTASSSILQGAFFEDISRALQIACLTGTGDQIREWLYLPVKKLNRHLGIFAQSGSGKSYAVGRLIEELLVKIYPRKLDNQVLIIIIDPNGDFNNFSKSRDKFEILTDIDKTFQGKPAFVPYLSWENWVDEQIRKVEENKIFQLSSQFPTSRDPQVTWRVINIEDDDNLEKTYQNLNEIQQVIFSSRRPHATFIVIDEAHNVVPKEKQSDTNRERCQKIVNKIAAEGRKFGAFLILITQSPSKIHPDTLSQCANLIVMKTTTTHDIKVISELRKDVPYEWIERAANFRQGEGLFMGDFVTAPVMAKIVGRISMEGGRDVKL